MVKVKFIKQENIYKCFSNFIDKDIDLLELLVLDLYTQKKIKEFQETVFFRYKNYQMEVVNVELFDDKILLTENYPFDDNNIASKAIHKGVLKKIINDWSLFLQSKKEFKKEYYL